MAVFLYYLLINSDSHFCSSKHHLFNKRSSHNDLCFIFEADISSYHLMKHNILFITYSLFPSAARCSFVLSEISQQHELWKTFSDHNKKQEINGQSQRFPSKEQWVCKPSL